MRKLQALTKFLRNGLNLRRESINSFADQCPLTPAVKDLGHGLQLGIFKYQAVVSIEDFKGDASLLLALVLAWLEDNDPERDHAALPDPEVDVAELDNKHFDVELAIEFEEALEIVPDEDGPLTFRGKQWRIASVEIDVAEEFTLIGRASEDGSAELTLPGPAAQEEEGENDG